MLLFSNFCLWLCFVFVFLAWKSLYDEAISSSILAQELTRFVDSVFTGRALDLTIGGWIKVSFNFSVNPSPFFSASQPQIPSFAAIMLEEGILFFYSDYCIHHDRVP